MADLCRVPVFHFVFSWRLSNDGLTNRVSPLFKSVSISTAETTNGRWFCYKKSRFRRFVLIFLSRLENNRVKTKDCVGCDSLPWLVFSRWPINLGSSWRYLGPSSKGLVSSGFSTPCNSAVVVLFCDFCSGATLFFRSSMNDCTQDFYRSSVDCKLIRFLS